MRRLFARAHRGLMVVVMAACLLLVAAPCAAAGAQPPLPGSVVSLSTAPWTTGSPIIDGDLVAWEASDGEQSDLFAHDGAVVHRLTDDSRDDWITDVVQGHLVWISTEYIQGPVWQGIFVSDGGASRQIAENVPPVTLREYRWAGWMGGDRIAWLQTDLSDSSAELGVTDGADRMVLTNPGEDVHSVESDAARGWLAWQVLADDYRSSLYLFDGTQTRLLSNEGADVSESVMADGWLAWTVWNADYTQTLFLFDGTQTRTLSGSDEDVLSCSVDNGFVAWSSVYQDRKTGLRLFDGSATHVVNPAAPGDPDTRAFQLKDGRLAWEGDDGTDVEVFLYEDGVSLRLTDNDSPDQLVRILDGPVWLDDDQITGMSDTALLWDGHDGHDWEVFRFEDGVSTQLTDNEVDDWGVWVSGGGSVYLQDPDGQAYEEQVGQQTRLTYYLGCLYVTEGDATWQLSDSDSVRLELYPFSDTHVLPGILASEDSMVWQTYPDTYLYLYDRSAIPGPAFLDVPASHPYAAAVSGLAARGIVVGYEVTGGLEFRPGNPVLRAQFAKMICGALERPVTDDLTSPFTDLGEDVPGNLYPHEFVAAAYRDSITTGLTPTTFAPYADITRAQVVTMVVRAARNLDPGRLDEPPAGYQGSLGDFSTTHAESMRWAESNGLLEDLDGFGPGWDPWQKATRGEVAQILWALMEE